MRFNQNVIVLTKGDEVEVWGTMVDVCKAHPEFSYYTLRNKKFPFTYKGVKFRKVVYREANF